MYECVDRWNGLNAWHSQSCSFRLDCEYCYSCNNVDIEWSKSNWELILFYSTSFHYTKLRKNTLLKLNFVKEELPLASWQQSCTDNIRSQPEQTVQWPVLHIFSLNSWPVQTQISWLSHLFLLLSGSSSTSQCSISTQWRR